MRNSNEATIRHRTRAPTVEHAVVREGAFPEARFSARPHGRDHGAGVRQDQQCAGAVPLIDQDLVSRWHVHANVTHSLEPAKAALIKDTLDQFGQVRIRVTGSSMLPSIWPGDVLTIHRGVTSDVRGGDVVLFTRDG